MAPAELDLANSTLFLTQRFFCHAEPSDRCLKRTAHHMAFDALRAME
jgi:hypothetical protein